MKNNHNIPTCIFRFSGETALRVLESVNMYNAANAIKLSMNNSEINGELI